MIPELFLGALLATFTLPYILWRVVKPRLALWYGAATNSLIPAISYCYWFFAVPVSREDYPNQENLADVDLVITFIFGVVVPIAYWVVAIPSSILWAKFSAKRAEARGDAQQEADAEVFE